MQVVYGKGFEVASRMSVLALEAAVREMPQYEPVTKHYFHGGMYCREVYRDAGVLVIGRVHKKEHFYLVSSGTLLVTTDDGVQRLEAGALLLSKPGAKRAVYSETPATCMTFHRTDATTVEAAELELVEAEENPMFDCNNLLIGDKIEVLT